MSGSAATVFRDLLTAFLTIAAITSAAPGPPQQPTPANATPANATAGNATAANVSPPVATDPAAVVFTTDLGLVLHTVKPASVADYEAAIVALQEAMASSDDPETRKVASSWRVLKAAEVDAKSNVIYVHAMEPALAGVDYRPSLWLDDLLDGAPAELLTKYRDAFAAPPTKLGLTEFAAMSVAPVAAANASPEKPVKGPPR